MLKRDCLLSSTVLTLLLTAATGDAFAHAHGHAHGQEEFNSLSMRQGYSTQRNVHGYHPDALSRFSVQDLDHASMQHIALRFAVEYRDGDQFVVLVPPWKEQELRVLAPDASLLDEEISPLLSGEDLAAPAGYRNYDEVRKTFETWQKEHPNLVSLVDRPDMVSRNGKPFILAKLTKDPQKDHPKRPKVVITAATHGDEHLTTESLLVNLEKLVKGYESNPRFKKMLDWAQVYIVPVVSPDSFLRARNVHGVDPNRVYDFPGDPSPGTKLKSANEMIAFYKDLEPDGVLDFHGAPPKGMIMCPWGHKRNASIEDKKDRDFHLKVVKAMGKATPGYKAGPIWSTIYVAPGNTTDHNYYRHKMLAIVIEIGGGDKSPPISKIPKLAKEIEEATWIFVESLLPASDPNEGSEEGDEESSTGGGEEDEDTTTTGGKDEESGDSDSTEKDPENDSEKSEDSTESPESKKPDDSKDKPEDDSKTPEDPEESEGQGEQGTRSPEGDKNEKPKGGGCSVEASGSTPTALGLLGLLGWFGRRRRDAVRR